MLGMENPGVFIPPIPPVDMVKDSQIKTSKASSDLVQERRRLLETFLQKCVECPYLNQSRVLQQFLEESTPFDLVQVKLAHSFDVAYLRDLQLETPQKSSVVDYLTKGAMQIAILSGLTEQPQQKPQS